MKVQAIEVWDQDLETVDGERFYVLQADRLGFLERSGPPEVLRFDRGGDTLDVGWREFQADGARLAGGAIGWPVPGGAVV